MHPDIGLNSVSHQFLIESTMRSIWWKIATGQYKFYNSILHKKECMIQFEQIFIFTILEMKQLSLPIQPIWDVIVGYEFWFLLWIYCICTELTFDVYNNITYPWSLPLGNPPPLAIFMTLRVSWESAGRLSLVSVSISSLSCYGRFFEGFSIEQSVQWFPLSGILQGMR